MLIFVLTLAPCSEAQPATQPPKIVAELMATLEALPPTPTLTPEELAQQEEAQTMFDEWWEEEYGTLFPIPTPDPRYKGCREAVEAYHAAMMNYYETEITYYPYDKEILAEEYFERLGGAGHMPSARKVTRP